VRNAFLPPTALKLMRREDVAVPPSLRMRTIMSGGESLGEEILAWTRERLGVTVNEIFGQTECNYVVGNSSALYPVRPGSMGRGYAGHDVAILGENGTAAPAGTMGEIAVRTPDPVAFLHYWNNPQATAAKYRGDWLMTGDLGVMDDDGYLWYRGRADDVINSSGYRIGPTEIENCLMRHHAVALAAVIGVPDPVRGEVVKACIVTTDGASADDSLAADLQSFVRSRLAAYQYPRIIEFVTELPMTTTGKIRRAELRQAHLESVDVR
jgi:acetyl-CoA synthetase